jgi:CRP-like cAMP-binding protein
MVSLQPLFLYLHKFVELSHDEFDQYLKPFIQIRHFKKREIITSSGEVEQYFNFILEGLALKYYKQDGDEHIVQIGMEGQIIHAQESFHSRNPSEYTIEALEPTIMASITFDDLEQIYSSSHKMERLGRLVITFSFVLQHKWQMQAVKLSPRDRFLKFMERNPELLQRVPQKHLASYLNIQPETFSRFKHILRAKR